MPQSLAPQGLRNVAAVLTYQGQGFAGWQRQPQQRTVEGQLRQALNGLHRPGGAARPGGRDVIVQAAGRTDSGVHARGQVINFYSDIDSGNLPTPRFCAALNSLLPKDIRLLRCWDVDRDFHARYSATARVYHYQIIQGQGLGPSQRQNAWYVRSPPLDIATLNSMISVLIGQHDFSAFAAAGDPSCSKVRRLYVAVFYYSGAQIVCRIVGNAFLWHMVRNIVGSCVFLYSQHYKNLEQKLCPKRDACSRLAEQDSIVDQVYAERLLLRQQLAQKLRQQAKDRGKANCNAPAHGLSLEQVIYCAADRPWYWYL